MVFFFLDIIKTIDSKGFLHDPYFVREQSFLIVVTDCGAISRNEGLLHHILHCVSRPIFSWPICSLLYHSLATVKTKTKKASSKRNNATRGKSLWLDVMYKTGAQCRLLSGATHVAY